MQSLDIYRLLKLTIFLFVIILIYSIVKVYVDKPTLITVTGTGKVNVAPTQVTMTVTFANEDKTAQEALANNTRLAKTLMETAKQNGVSEKDMIVAYARVVPPGSGIVTYQAVNTLDLTLRNLNNLDKLVSSLYGAGTVSVSNIVFTTENSQVWEKQAVEKAVADAQSRASEMAQKMGKRVGRIVSLATQEAGGAGALSGQASTATTLGGVVLSSPSMIEISRQASIVFELN